ncbi:hypothetical protein IP88_08720 [alpha proteobacterium AAP81b]|nr:hypothetical protein IP88_08720 [alpha proteobacterium AAP81b]
MNSIGFGDLVAAVLPALAVGDKPALFGALAEAAAAATGLPADLILARLQERELLGSTGFGDGTAIPHARIADLPRVTALVARLAPPVDYGALDGGPVDLVVLLLSPEGAGADHLKALARISRTLRSPAAVAGLRAAGDEAALRAALGGLAQAA